MKDKILEIIQNNYNKFKGTNEAELHSANEIESFFKEFLSDFGTKIKAVGFNEGFDEANSAREKQIDALQNKLKTAKEFINYCKSQPDIYVHANKCLAEIE